MRAKTIIMIFIMFVVTLSGFNKSMADGVFVHSKDVSVVVNQNRSISTPPRGSAVVYINQLPSTERYAGKIWASDWFITNLSPYIHGYSDGAVRVDGSNDGVNWTTLGTIFSYDARGTSGSNDDYYEYNTVNLYGQYQWIRVVLIDTWIGGLTDGVTGSGTVYFQIYSAVADQTTVNQARDAAQSAASAANAAKSASEQARDAANSVNTIVNSTLTVNAGVVQDSSGTVLQAARQARDKASEAVSRITNAEQNLQNSLANLGNNLNNISNDLKNSLQNVSNTINNIQALIPPTLTKVAGYNGATATQSGTFKIVLDYSNATEYRVKVDSGPWSAWTPMSDYEANGYITVSLGSKGVHTIYVEIRNGSATAKGSMKAFRL